MPESKLMLIDGNSLLFRAFYALPLLHTRDGIYTNGVFGFLTMFNRVIAEERPTHVVVAFDKDRDTFRKEIYTEYKANRSVPPDELKGQFGLLREVLSALNITYLEMQGYEADDIIGTLSRRAEEEGLKTVIVTGDGDALQLVSDQVTVLMNRKGISDIEMFDPAHVLEKWEVGPGKMIEIKALMGDASDNIPGVPGIGPKTAVKLVKEFGSLENLYEHLHEVKGKKLVERLRENKEQAFLSRQLATIDRYLDITWNLDDYSMSEPDLDRLVDLYKRLEFNNLLNSLPESLQEGNQPAMEQEIEISELQSEAEVLLLIEKARSTEAVALEVEADYHHPMWANLKRLYIELNGVIYYLKLEENVLQRLSWIKPLLEAEDIAKIMHNTKFAQVALQRWNIKLRGFKGDTLLMAYVNNPSFEGDSLAEVLSQFMKINIDPGNRGASVAQIRRLFNYLKDNTAPELVALCTDVEMPLSDVLAHMEATGIRVDGDILKNIAKDMSQGLLHSEASIYELAGEQFNINSPKQLGKVLFEDLGLRVIKKTKTGYATGIDVLEALYDEHEIIPHILNYRQLAKLKSTYLDGLSGLIHPDTGRVHTIFKQAQTATGRLSSVEPNLQNIPIRMEEGRRIRRAFTAEKGWLIVSADYSQIDLRSLAHISGDEVLIDTFKQGIDIHTRTAAEIFKVPLDKVDENLRRQAKAVNFGIIYGISDFGLSRDTGVSRKEARLYIENYLNSYPGVKKYMDDIVKFGQEHGYVETLLKRRRYLPDLNARNKMAQSFARRMALNTPIQGTSADIIKLAMIRVFAEINYRELQSRLLLQVHDDMILEVPEQEVAEIASILHNCMENAVELKVPLEVSIKAGPNWYELKDL